MTIDGTPPVVDGNEVGAAVRALQKTAREAADVDRARPRVCRDRRRDGQPGPGRPTSSPYEDRRHRLLTAAIAAIGPIRAPRASVRHIRRTVVTERFATEWNPW